MPKRLFVAAPLALLAAAAVGCGAPASSETEFEGDERDVAEVVEDLQTAAVEEEPKTVCDDLFTAELKAKARDCEQAVEDAFDDTDTSELTVDSVRVTGANARAQVFVGSDEERKELMTFQKIGDDWRIASLGEPVS